MKAKKIFSITFVILLVLVFYGCTLKKNEAPITGINVYQGTDGLEISFLKGSPPQEIYEGENFQIATLLKNKGAYPINYGNLVMTYEEGYVNATGSKKQTFRLKGKEVYDPSSDETVKNFFLNAEKIPEQMSIEHKSVVLVTACYDYATKLNTQICIDTDPHKTKTIEKACETKDLSFSGQGAPVEIAKIEQKMLITDEGKKIRPQFHIYIKNSGNGQVISKTKINEACGSSGIGKDDINGVILKDVRFSEYTKENIECLPDKPLKLVNGEDYFVCTLKEEFAIPVETATFTSNLYLELEYGYTITKSSEFTIKKLTT